MRYIAHVMPSRGMTCYTEHISEWTETCSSSTPSDNPPDPNSPGGNGTTRTPAGGTTQSLPVPPPVLVYQGILNCINGIPLNGPVDTVTIDPAILSQISLNLGQWTAMKNYLLDNGCSEQAQADVVENIYTIIRANLSACLGSEHRASINSLSYENLGAIHSYLIVGNGCSEEAVDLAILAIVALQNGDVEDFYEYLVENVPPDCESFDYTRIGGTNWQVAGVSNVHDFFIIANWNCIGYDWGIFTQPLYFQLPINSLHPLNSGVTKVESSAYLHLAFVAFNVWYQQNGCNAGGATLEQKLLEYIKDEFEEHGGNVTLTPPSGFNGIVNPYKITWSGYGNCN